MSTKEIIIPEIFEGLFDPQFRYKCFYGGRGGGKSENIARALLIMTSCNKKRILCTREIQNSIRDSVFKLLTDLIEFYELPGFSVTNNSIKHVNGSEFLFKGLYNNIQSIKSLQEIDICWVEEAQTISKESIDILLPTIRAENSQIWFSFNRKNEDDPVWKEFCLEPDNLSLIKKVNYNDNPFFPEVLEKERLRCLKNKPDDYSHIWEGEPSKSHSGSVVKNFSYENVRKINYLPFKTLHLSCDFNVDPMSWVIAHIAYDRQGNPFKAFFLDEIVEENTSTSKTIDDFHQKMLELNNGKANFKQKIVINGDASGSYRHSSSEFTNYTLMQKRLSELGYRNVELAVRNFNPPIKSRIEAFNNMVVGMDSNRKIFISPKCKYLLMNCKKLRYKIGTSKIDIPTTSQIKNNPELKFLSHIFDAASYLVEYYWPIVL